MGEGTEYFTPEFFDCFRGLAKNNRKEWFDANKAQFQAVVLEPSVRFVRDAGARLKKSVPTSSGTPALRRIRLPDLPGHSVLAGQEPVQDPYPNPFLARQGGTAGAHDAGLLSPPGVRGERRPFWRLASGAADPQENPGSNRRRARCVEDRSSIEDPTRRRVPKTAPARLRSEPSANPGPASKGLHCIASLPRYRRREPGFLGEFRERMRVDGPSKPIPRAVDGIAVVTSTWRRERLRQTARSIDSCPLRTRSPRDRIG